MADHRRLSTQPPDEAAFPSEVNNEWASSLRPLQCIINHIGPVKSGYPLLYLALTEKFAECGYGDRMITGRKVIVVTLRIFKS